MVLNTMATAARCAVRGVDSRHTCVFLFLWIAAHTCEAFFTSFGEASAMVGDPVVAGCILLTVTSLKGPCAYAFQWCIASHGALSHLQSTARVTAPLLSCTVQCLKTPTPDSFHRVVIELPIGTQDTPPRPQPINPDQNQNRSLPKRV